MTERWSLLGNAAGRGVPRRDEADEPPVSLLAGPVHGRHRRRRIETPPPPRRVRVDVDDPPVTVEGAHAAVEVREVGFHARFPPPVRGAVVRPADPALLALAEAPPDLGLGERGALGKQPRDLGRSEAPPGDVGPVRERRQRAREVLHRHEELPPHQPARGRPGQPHEADRSSDIQEPVSQATEAAGTRHRVTRQQRRTSRGAACLKPRPGCARPVPRRRSRRDPGIPRAPPGASRPGRA